MNADTLHDALTLLPEDLVAETGRAREHRPRTRRWVRLAAMAACLTLVVFLGRLSIELFTPKGGAAPESLEAMTNQALTDQENSQYRRGDAAPAEVPDVQAAPAEVPEAGAGPSADAVTGSASLWLNQNTLHFFPLNSATATAEAETGAAASDTTNLLTTHLLESREALDAFAGACLTGEDRTAFADLCQVYDEAWFSEHSLLLVRLPDAGWTPVGLARADGVWTLTLEADETRESENPQWILLDLTAGVLTQADQVLVEYTP